MKLCVLSAITIASGFGCSSSDGGSDSPGHGGAAQGQGGGNVNPKGGGPGSGGAPAGQGGSGTGGSVTSNGGSVTGNGGSVTSNGGSVTSNGGSAARGGSTGVAGGSSRGGTGSGEGGNSSLGGANAAGRAGAGGRSEGGGAGAGAGGKSAGGASSSGGQGTAGANNNLPDKFVGNITTGNVSSSNPGMDQGGRVFAKYWNQVTPENAGKWGSVQSSATAQFNWAPLKAIYDYCQKNNVIFKEHTFVWGSQQPSGTIGETEVKAWMKGLCTQFPETKLIDVVNEAQHAPAPYASNIGGGNGSTYKWITNAYMWAREACPNAVLVFNDYNIIEHQADSDKFISIVKTVVAAGGPIDAVGAQGHDLDLSSVTFDTVQKLAENVHSQTGLPMYITEYDISMSDDNAQLAAYKQHFGYFLKTDWIKGVTVWGWIYGSTWSQAPDSGLIKNGSPRPAMTWLMDQLGRPAP